MALEFLITSFVTLFLIVDAVGNLPLFESMLHGLGHRDRLRTITLSTFVALITLLIFVYGGVFIFEYFNVNLYSFKIAGGILLLIISLQMLFGIRQRLSHTEEGEVIKRENIAIVPMAIPLQTGPGAITAGIVLASKTTTLTMQGTLLLSILLVFLISYLVYIKSEYFFKLLGEIGTKVVTRIMGLILAAIAVQYVVNGVMEVAALI